MATPFIRFPGVAGNNVYTEDTNGVDADTSHLEQSLGKWSASSGSSGIAQSTAQTPVFGSFVGECTMDGSSTAAIATTGGVGGIPILASTELTFSISFWALTAGNELRVQVTQYDGAGASLGTTSGSWNPTPFQSQYPLTFTTDASAVTFRFVVQFRKLDTSPPDLGELLYWDAAQWRQGTSGVFVPSLDVVGSLFVSEDASVTPVTYTYTPGSPLVLGDGYAGDVSQWALHDGADAAAPIVAQMLAGDALRALPL